MVVHVLYMRTCDKEGLRAPLNLSSLCDTPIKASHALISILDTKLTRAELEKTRYQAKHSLGAIQGINVQQLLQNVLKQFLLLLSFAGFLLKSREC